MRSSVIALAALAAVRDASAFPTYSEMADDSLVSRQQNGGFFEPKPPFNAKEQLVSVDGEHRFIAPGPDDVRGPCPGLNAMANHGYLPRNGVGGPLDFIQGTYQVFGMSPDLATILTTIGGTIDGNGVMWSIGGPSKYLPAPLPGLGTPQGISGSHNKYESDASPTRGDLFKFGNDFTMQLSQFEALYNKGQAAGDHYSLALLQEFRSERFDNSVATNPYFFNGPFSGVLVQPAAYEFIYRFMGNKSAQYPRGRLHGNVLMDFFGVKKTASGKLVKTDGHERIPYNWYKRNDADLYSQATLTADTLFASVQRKKFGSIGGNTGKPNSFVAIDPGNFTGGVITADNLFEGNNLACIALQFQQQAAPDLVKCSGVLANALSHVKPLQTQLGEWAAKLNCPIISKFNNDQFKQFPGYTKLKCNDGTYPK